MSIEGEYYWLVKIGLERDTEKFLKMPNVAVCNYDARRIPRREIKNNLNRLEGVLYALEDGADCGEPPFGAVYWMNATRSGKYRYITEKIVKQYLPKSVEYLGEMERRQKKLQEIKI